MRRAFLERKDFSPRALQKTLINFFSTRSFFNNVPPCLFPKIFVNLGHKRINALPMFVNSFFLHVYSSVQNIIRWVFECFIPKTRGEHSFFILKRIYVLRCFLACLFVFIYPPAA
jgi:hypothetical protein